MKSSLQAVAVAILVAAGAQYTVVDADGHVVGTLVTDGPVPSQMRVVGIANAARKSAPQPVAQPDRTFHPDYSHALTVDQMNRAWSDELDRLSPPVVTGGG